MPPQESASGALGEVELRPPRLEVDRLLDDPRTRIIVCCGSGGVGKTTTAAALGLRAAERGRHVVVLTVDPARRLAQSMGLTSLDNTPRPVPLPDVASAASDDGGDSGADRIRKGRAGRARARAGAAGDGEAGDGEAGDSGAGDGEAGDSGAGHGSAGGSMHAMMLDMKRTFDEIVEAHSDPDRAAQILANPFYQSLSSSFAGTQEYMAMEKLGQLRRADEWDLIVVDTPPSRSALDFLDAPQRLSRFLDGRLIRLLTAPTRVSGRAYLKVVNAGFGMFTGVVTKVLGAQVLRDVQTFVAALDTMFGGFRERAEDTYRLLQTPGTAFLVIATPEPDALREASYFVERLSQDRMPLAGLILNRVHPSPAARLSAARSLAAAEALQAAGGTDGDGTGGDGSSPAAHNDGAGETADGPRHPLAVTALRLHAERTQLAAAERRLAQRFTAAHPGVPAVRVPAQPEDVHDLAGLRTIGESFGAS